MDFICEYCGSRLTGHDRTCPSCGAPVPPEQILPESAPAAASAPSGRPRTIEELRAFSMQHNLPLEKMRVFIGQDYKEPKAFGIFRESDSSVVVYKNKADGTRAVRYRGPDEAFAVNELYEKMHEMVRQQKARKAAAGNASSGSGIPKAIKWVFVVILVMVLYAILSSCRSSTGYYRYNNNYYYQQDGSWFAYQNNSWIPYVISGDFADHYDDYYESDDFSDSYGVKDFADSNYYEAPRYDNDDDWDDDWGDWDDGGGDWDSDW